MPVLAPQDVLHAIHEVCYACLQGGSEARHSNELLHHIISNAIDTVAPEVGSGLIALVNSRDEIRDLLKLDDVIDLVS